MKNVSNPVVSEEVAEQIATTFVSVNVDAHLPVSMQSPQELAKSKADLDDNKALDESSRNKIRLSIQRRETTLLERQIQGGFLDFGQIVTSGVEVTTRGLNAYLTNYKKQKVKMILNKFNLKVMSDLYKAQLIAEAQGKKLYLYTSAWGDYPNTEWFDTIYVKIK
jgi:hypothetical protein